MRPTGASRSRERPSGRRALASCTWKRATGLAKKKTAAGLAGTTSSPSGQEEEGSRKVRRLGYAKQDADSDQLMTAAKRKVSSIEQLFQCAKRCRTAHRHLGVQEEEGPTNKFCTKPVQSETTPQTRTQHER